MNKCYQFVNALTWKNVMLQEMWKQKTKMTAYSVIFPLKQGAILKNSVGAKSMYKVVEVGWKPCNKKRWHCTKNEAFH